MKKYIKKSKEEKKNEMDQVLENLQNGVKEVFTSENYLNYLKFFSQFPTIASIMWLWF